MEVNMTVITYSNGKKIATADFPEDVIEQIKDSFPPTSVVKNFINDMMPIAVVLMR